MWTRGKDKANQGKFQIEVFAADGSLVLRQGGFDTAGEADRAAEIAQREVLFPAADVEMTDDELLEALGL
jgi:hypothetical protein